MHEWTARLWPALAGFLGVLAIGCAGYALGGAALGAYAGLALAATLCTPASRRSSRWIPGLVVLPRARASPRSSSPSAPNPAPARAATWMWVAWAALAGATLSKGLIGVVLPGGALVVYTALTRDFALWRRLHLGVRPRAVSSR